MKSVFAAGAIFLLATFMAACSVVMEATRPTPTDLNYFQTGMTRDQVMEKLGAPDTTVVESDGAACDFYKLYTRGYGAGGKVPIAVAEAAADFFTLGLAEVALTPTEGVTRNEKHPVAFCYRGQTLVRITADSQPTAGAAPTVAAMPALEPGQNPPITAAQSEASGVSPSAGVAAIPTFAPTNTPTPDSSATASSTPTTAPSASPSPSPTPTASPSPEI